jgi:hypothetical protein
MQRQLVSAQTPRLFVVAKVKQGKRYVNICQADGFCGPTQNKSVILAMNCASMRPWKAMFSQVSSCPYGKAKIIPLYTEAMDQYNVVALLS